MANPKILFVDDDNFLRKVYQSELQDKGFDVVLAVDGDDGLRKVAEAKPDLVILDLIMPARNGFEMLSDLESRPETRKIPVIVLSNLAQSEDQKRALDLGAVDYLVKDNTTLDIIADKIQHHLSVAKKRQPDKRETAIPAEPVPTRSTPQGAPAASDATAKERRADESSRQTSASPTHAHNFCGKCGYKLGKTDKYCPECGHHIDE